MNPTPPLPQNPYLPDQATKDQDHLKTLIICHYVMAGLSILGLLLIFFHYYMMSTVFEIAESTPTAQGGPMPEGIMDIMIVFYLIVGLLVIAQGIMNFLSARFLKSRTNRTFCFITAGINCLQMPLGTALGIFTFIVLGRNSVAQLFKGSSQS